MLTSLEGYFKVFELVQESTQASLVNKLCIFVMNNQPIKVQKQDGIDGDFTVLRIPNPLLLATEDRNALASFIAQQKQSNIKDYIVIVDASDHVSGIIPPEEYDALAINLSIDNTTEEDSSTFGVDIGILGISSPPELSLWCCPNHPEFKPYVAYSSLENIPPCPKCKEKRIPYKIKTKSEVNSTPVVPNKQQSGFLKELRNLFKSRDKNKG